ncbi:hypothetical protein ANN_09805 [Periplaneta americana]|uniref:Uncharacterized protein n=1 Tax=Periplaneta americana TaxID=6978 RepID=A0ABQ8TPZ4_PERAM|nr:hypothetical protein ANN_09805 [Periplaneta americana]
MPPPHIQACVQLIGALLLYELQNILEKRKREHGSRNGFVEGLCMVHLITLLKELAEEDPAEYRKHLRMSPEKFDELLTMIEPSIRKQDTVMRMAIPTRTKLEITLRYLASGDSFKTLHHLYRVSANTISCFLPEVLSAIFDCLHSYIKVSN